MSGPNDFISELFGAAVGSTPAIQDRGYQLAWLGARDSDRNKVLDAAADPTHSQWLFQLGLNNLTRTFWGRVRDVVAYTGVYKVQLEHTHSTVNCVIGTHTGLQPMGVRQFNSIPIDAAVYVLMHPNSDYGLIIAVEPEFMTNGNKAMPDFISQAGRSGLSVDLCHKSPFKLQKEGFIEDHSSGRPFDATGGMEHGYITETGLCHSIDPFMSQLRVDEETGFYSFYWDQTARMSGHNLQIWSAGHERLDQDDESEFSSVHQYSPYIWETLGVKDPNTSISRDVAADDWQLDPSKQGYAAVEPKEDDQISFWRLQDWYGYLGQGHRRLLALPPADDPGPWRMSSPPPISGVYNENLSLTGRKSFGTAHEIIITKRLPIIAPQQKKLASDANGDTDENYKFAGVYGDGDEHQVKGAVSGDDGWQRVAAFMDTQAFVFNWEALHPFYYHKEDYDTPQESATGVAGSVPDFTALQTQQFLPVPTPIEVTVDHRYGTVKYYPNHSYWALLADGGSVWGDGYYSELRMAQGCLDVTAPADVNILAGRNVHVRAGNDVNITGHDSVDVNATCHDVRIKGQHNVHIVANDDCSSILLQCNADGDYCDIQQGESCTFGGIMFKAKDSTIGSFARRIHLTTEDIDGGEIISEARQGQIRAISKFNEVFVSQAILQMFFHEATAEEIDEDPEAGATVDTVNQFWFDNTIICTPLRVNGDVAVNGCTFAGGSIFIADGYIYAEKAMENGYSVPSIPAAPLATVKEAIGSVDMTCVQALSTGQDELAILEEFPLCTEVEFSWRTDAEMLTTNWELWEPRWQQFARLNEQTLDTWEETSVVFQESDTYPYPGTRWTSGDAYHQQNLKLYDATNLQFKDRPENYENPSFETKIDINPDGNYLIVH